MNDILTTASALALICALAVVVMFSIFLLAMNQEIVRVLKKINFQLDRIEGTQAAEAEDLSRLKGNGSSYTDWKAPPTDDD